MKRRFFLIASAAGLGSVLTACGSEAAIAPSTANTSPTAAPTLATVADPTTNPAATPSPTTTPTAFDFNRKADLDQVVFYDTGELIQEEPGEKIYDSLHEAATIKIYGFDCELPPSEAIPIVMADTDFLSDFVNPPTSFRSETTINVSGVDGAVILAQHQVDISSVPDENYSRFAFFSYDRTLIIVMLAPSKATDTGLNYFMSGLETHLHWK